MSLPNVNITLGNGNMGAISLSDDGIAALIVTGKEVTDKLKLKKVYVLASAQDLKQLGADETNNPLVCKEVNGFYTAAGEGAELHLMVVSEATTLTHMCTEDEEGDSPMKMLINSAAGRIRLVGINRNPPQDYVPTVSGNLDADVISAMAAAHSVAESYLGEIAPFRVLVPALGWNGETAGLYQPREGSYNRVAVVLASDGLFGDSNYYSAAIGQVLGRAAKISVQQNLGRVRDGAIAAEGFLTDGSTPEEHYSVWNLLDDAGYIFYRTFIGKNGYYLNGDHMAAPVSDDYSYLSLGRTVDKAVVIAYQTYIDDILDNIVVDENGSLPVAICKNFEASIIRAVNTSMSDEISSFSAYIDPDQNVLANGKMEISCQIVPMGTLRQININLSLNNPTE